MKNSWQHIIGWFKGKIDTFRKLSRTRKIFFVTWALFSLILITVIATTAYFANTLSSKDKIMNRNNTGVTLVDRNDEEFYSFYNARSNTFVSLNDISKPTQQALVAAEDKDFYQHSGFSFTGIIQAVYENLRPSGLDSGGSTITQQLVKNALLTEERSIWRKYQEIILSIEIERRYTKTEILEMYLNSVYFGEGAFGIENAAQTYFGKSAKDLTAAEASMLVGVLPAPSAYSPITGNPEFAKERQEYVLGRMAEDSYITESEASSSEKQELTYQPPQEAELKAPHFALMVKEKLLEQYSEEEMARSGMTVKTSIDLNFQRQAEEVVASQVDALAYAQVGNGSAVAIDPETRELLVLVGSKDWNEEKYGKVNIATTPRQPGSSFKPIVYATGIENRQLSAATVLHDQPTDFNGYKPENYDLAYRGEVTVRNALANSLNIPVVEALQDIGIGNTINTAKSLGVTTLEDDASAYGLSLALGTGEVPLTEMTNVYATFADQGAYKDLQLIRTITDKNKKEVFNIEKKDKPEAKTAISNETAFIISSILSDDVARSATFGNSLTLSRTAAVKTGTSEEYRNEWTMGYTPNLAVGVWIGNNDNSPMSVASSVGAGPIWRSIMEEILATKPVEEFTPPSSIVQQLICRYSGAIAENEGGNTITEYFRSSTLPSTRCNESLPEPEPEESTPPRNEEPESEEEEEEEPITPEPEEEEPTEDPDPNEEEPTDGEEDPDSETPNLPVTP